MGGKFKDKAEEMFGLGSDFQQFHDPLDLFGVRAGAAGDLAADRQMGMLTQSQQFQEQMFENLVELQQPFLNAGDNAVGIMAALSGSLGPAAQREAMQNMTMSPGARHRLDEGRKTITQNAAAQGNLLGGNTMKALQSYGTGIAQQDLANQYNQLGAVARLGQQAGGAVGGVGSATSSGIAADIRGAGDAAAQSILASQQAQAQNTSQAAGMIGSIIGMFSDVRLKENIEVIGHYGPITVNRWDWNEEAKKLGLEGSSEGHIAQEVQEHYPELVQEKDGYLQVMYGVDGKTMRLM